MTLNILLVDDDHLQRKLVKDAAEIFQKGGLCEIVIDEVDNFSDGLAKLRSTSYDAAILDLRLDNDEKAKGNELLREIKSSLRYPVRVISGFLEDLEEGLSEDSIFVNICSRDEVDYNKIFTDFLEINKTGITGILNSKGRIESQLNDIFWKHIAFTLPEFIKLKKSNDSIDIEKALLRYIASHILEYLEIDSESKHEEIQAIEFYIKPPIKPPVFTGDIVKGPDNRYWVVLTPACDLATDTNRPVPKAEFVTIAAIETNEEVEKEKKEIKRLKTNSGELKYHYLPTTILFEGGFINFQQLRSVPIQEMNRFTVECVITSPFRKDIISRFANYYSRQGQPAFYQ
jgi:CheY-like chemotaxis protein